jgi:hypothetical protein
LQEPTPERPIEPAGGEVKLNVQVFVTPSSVDCHSDGVTLVNVAPEGPPVQYR